MRFGIYMPNFGPSGDVHAVVELARRAEASGWDGLFLWDHFEAAARPVLDPWVALTAVALQTERLTVGPMIVPLARRRPQKVALEAATLAALAPGRFVLGAGLGAPRDFELFGEDAHWRVRADKVDAGVAALRRAWAGEEIADGVQMFEAPLPDIPVWVSGEWPRKQPFHGVEHANGAFPIGRDGERWRPLPPDQVRECRASLPARARDDFAIWGWGDTGEHELAEYVDAGATWWMVELFGLSLDERFAIVDAGPQRLSH